MSIRAAPAVPAKVHGHDAVAFAREMLELGCEVGVIAGYTVDQQDRRLIALFSYLIHPTS